MGKRNGSTGTGNDGTLVDADTDPDGVSAALGLDDAPEGEDTDDEQDPDEVDETDEGDDDEPTLADVLAELRELKRSNAQLKREAAERRVAGKTESKGTTSSSDSDGETVEQALARGREEARAEYGLELAGASIRAALTGVIPENDLDDFVDDLRLDRYVGEDGKPDRDAIAALKDRQAKITRRRPAGRNVGHARQGSGSGEKSKGDIMAETLTSLGL
jgi:hypothetical protein